MTNFDVGILKQAGIGNALISAGKGGALGMGLGGLLGGLVGAASDDINIAQGIVGGGILGGTFGGAGNVLPQLIRDNSAMSLGSLASHGALTAGIGLLGGAAIRPAMNFYSNDNINARMAAINEEFAASIAANSGKLI